MPTTTEYAIPYPSPGDAPDVPYWMQQLAERVEAIQSGFNMGTPTTTSSAGTSTSGTTETRDTVLGNYVFTAVSGRRYQVIVNGLHLAGSVLADDYTVRVRNGGASTPTSGSTLIASRRTYTPEAALAVACYVSGTFVPGAGTQTLGVFTVRNAGSGVGTPFDTRELYVIDIGAA